MSIERTQEENWLDAGPPEVLAPVAPFMRLLLDSTQEVVAWLKSSRLTGSPLPQRAVNRLIHFSQHIEDALSFGANPPYEFLHQISQLKRLGFAVVAARKLDYRSAAKTSLSYVVREGDTWKSIAHHTGYGMARWYELAQANGGEVEDQNTTNWIGRVLKIPRSSVIGRQGNPNFVATEGKGREQLGIGIAWSLNGPSLNGTSDDLATIEYEDNYRQTILGLLETETGELMEAPHLGFDVDSHVGESYAPIKVEFTKMKLEQAIMADPRTRAVQVKQVKASERISSKRVKDAQNYHITAYMITDEKLDFIGGVE